MARRRGDELVRLAPAQAARTTPWNCVGAWSRYAVFPASGTSPWLVSEHGTLDAGLSDVARTHLVAELRARATAAAYDERSSPRGTRATAARSTSRRR